MARSKRTAADGYEDYKAGQAAISRERSAAGREIGPLPPVADPVRRERGRTDPEFFNKSYFPNRFYLDFGKPHRLAMATLADCTEHGGLFAFAMMRGGGKTMLAECEVMRALLYGFRRYVLFIGATDGLADKACRRIFGEFETNDLLAADFPEVCYPVRALDRITQRARGQTLDDKPTRMQITEGSVILPTVDGSAASGAAFQSFGLTGAFKGLNLIGPGGVSMRPDLVIVDDAQTRESAKSVAQTEYRERLICDDVLGLAGPTTDIAAVFLCTPIYKNDLSERFVSRELHPDWNGVRTQMVERFPTNTKAWEEYGDVLRESLRAGDKGDRANEFYAARREEMDAGCELAWPERKKDSAVSAVQSAMNLAILNPTGFGSEYQCQPEEQEGDREAFALDADAIAAKVNRVPRREVPPDCTRLTAFVDCAQNVLWYAVVAWDETFGGGVVDYGAWPPQPRKYFTQRDASPTLAERYAGLDEGQTLYAGLKDLTADILGRDYRRQTSGESMKVSRCFVDEGWKDHVVYQFCRESVFSAVLLPSKGHAPRNRTATPLSKWKRREGEKVGHNWRVGPVSTGKGRHCIFDPNPWKSHIAERLLAEPGGRGCLKLYGESASAHRMLADQLTAEAPSRETIDGVTADVWELRPARDNHLFDCLVGCAIAASEQGLTWSASDTPGAKRVKKKAVDIEELYRANRGG